MPKKPFHVGVLTLFPNLFPGPLGISIFQRARDQGLWTLQTFNIRDHAPQKLKGRMDAPPFGGGKGMILRADAIAPAIDAATKKIPNAPLICLTPAGKPLTQARIQKLAQGNGVILLCSRYEGLDERIIEARNAEEISIGDFLLSGGETAALALIEAALRILPGVMGSEESGTAETFHDNLLQHPHYTKPALWENRAAPEILLSGHHARVKEWREAQALRRTRLRRPDLAEKHDKTAKTMLEKPRRSTEKDA